MDKKDVSKNSKYTFIPTVEFYRQIIDSIQDYAIFTVDKDLVINSWNAGAENQFGYSSNEVLGEFFDIIFTDEDKESGVPQEEINTSLKEGRAVDNRWHVRKDGSKFFANGLVFPLKRENGALIGFVKILRDLTDKKRSEDSIKQYIEELEELNTHKENILSIISHDLRSPLGGIITASEYLKNNFDTMERDEIKEMIGLIHRSTVKELNMLDYLVEWARITYAAEVFSPHKIDLPEHVDKAFELLGETLINNEITLENKVKPSTFVYADEHMLMSVLHNIISNAIKHSDDGDRITVSAKARENNHSLVVEIKDTGEGMAKEIQDKLFSPQMSTLLKAREEKKGAGIGLLLVKEFLNKNESEIWVKSKEGEGSSFFFTLPTKSPDGEEEK
jgi:PAS domain S-box-containing protein